MLSTIIVVLLPYANLPLPLKSRSPSDTGLIWGSGTTEVPRPCHLSIGTTARSATRAVATVSMAAPNEGSGNLLKYTLRSSLCPDATFCKRYIRSQWVAPYSEVPPLVFFPARMRMRRQRHCTGWELPNGLPSWLLLLPPPLP